MSAFATDPILPLEAMETIKFNMRLAEQRHIGEGICLINQVCRLHAKGLDSATIADNLEEDLTVVEQIIIAAESFAPDYNAEKIYRAVF